MDPISGIGLVASLAQLIDVSYKVVKYVGEVKDAPEQKKALELELANLLPLIMRLKQRIESARPQDSWLSTVRSLGVLNGPVPQLQVAMELLGKKLKSRKKMLGKNLLWPFEKKEGAEIFFKIERVKTLVGLALQDDLMNLTLAVKDSMAEGFTSMNNGLNVLSSEMDKMQMASQSRNDDAILDWLSVQTFSERQTEIYKNMTPGTCEWLLDTQEFPHFEMTRGTVLWCSGMPGAGKTVLMSYVVDHFRNRIPQNGVCTAVVYCNYKEPGQTAETLTASLLRQLVHDMPKIPEQIGDLHRKHEKTKTCPSLAEIVDIIRRVAKTRSKTFILIDAIDEYRENESKSNEFIRMLKYLSSDVHLLVTSRPNYLLEASFDDALKLEVRASVENVTLYLQSQLAGRGTFQRVLGTDTDLQKHIVETIALNCDGMFLMAKLQMDSIKSKRTRKAIRATVDTLPAELNGMYDNALTRIRYQGEEDASIAHKVLGWVVHATRPLTVQELQHALAVEPAQRDFDEEAIIEEEILLSVCLGLITIDGATGEMRLIHFTAQKYLQSKMMEIFPSPHLRITMTCLDYMSLQFFPRETQLHRPGVERQLLPNFPFLRYSLYNWGFHACVPGDSENEVTLEQRIFDFLKNHVTWLTTYTTLYRMTRISLWTMHKAVFPMKPACGLHIAASLDLSSYLYQLVNKGTNLDCSGNCCGYLLPSALQIAARAGAIGTVRFLLDHNADVQSSFMGSVPLSLSTKGGHFEVSKLLIERGATMDGGSSGKHPLILALEGKHETLALYLISKGADPNAINRAGNSALSIAAMMGLLDVMDALIDAHAHIDYSNDKFGCTALCRAVSEGERDAVSLLLDRGADINSNCNHWPFRCPIGSAIFKGDASMVEFLLKSRADLPDAVVINHPEYRYSEEILKVLVETRPEMSLKTINEADFILIKAVRYGSVTMVKENLEAAADINVEYINEFPILIAMASGHTDMVKFLISWQADLHGISKEKWLLKTSENEAKKRTKYKNGNTKGIYRYPDSVTEYQAWRSSVLVEQ